MKTLTLLKSFFLVFLIQTLLSISASADPCYVLYGKSMGKSVILRCGDANNTSKDIHIKNSDKLIVNSAKVFTQRNGIDDRWHVLRRKDKTTENFPVPKILKYLVSQERKGLPTSIIVELDPEKITKLKKKSRPPQFQMEQPLPSIQNVIAINPNINGSSSRGPASADSGTVNPQSCTPEAWFESSIYLKEPLYKQSTLDAKAKSDIPLPSNQFICQYAVRTCPQNIKSTVNCYSNDFRTCPSFEDCKSQNSLGNSIPILLPKKLAMKTEVPATTQTPTPEATQNLPSKNIEAKSLPVKTERSISSDTDELNELERSLGL